ncbi:type IV pilus modification protein PilV [Stutzerimonas decontaminans]|uniref:Type IV pilus modification protein PilV n=1 Tax=Stutzerimonas decontaminans TaxID=3022791 RepID=A0ABX4W0I0_9GAMM|nr:type IV pilus modification protein PilV [Stutzerimonas decontaminans]MCQ4245271.1 type IV pilus modification protein PilV [Stutzerimonas decontaminans]PNF85975.1 type IV pilus modification protein PilV [Stutzerimonas decontaminans]
MKTNNGFSLIEVLVALLLTTIGVLGMVALQGRSIQYTQDSVQRNTAIVLAGDLIEIVRAHPKELFNTSPPQFPMNSGLKGSSIFYKAAGDDFDDRESCVASPSRIAQTARELRDCWADKVEALLPGGSELFDSDVYVCRSSTPGDCDGKGSMLEIRLAWQVRDGACLDADNSDVCSYTVRVEP